MRVAICFRGVHYMNGEYEWTVNFEDQVQNFYDKIVNPLKNDGHTVDVFISTYKSIKSDMLQDIYKPIKIFYSPFIYNQDRYDAQYNHHNILFNAVMEYEKENSFIYDRVIATRFDLEMNYSITELNVNDNMFNAMYKVDYGDVDETFWIFPGRDTAAVLWTLNLMRDKNQNTHQIEKNYPYKINFLRTLKEYVANPIYNLKRKNLNDRWQRHRP